MSSRPSLLLFNNLILALNQAARIMPRREVAKPNVARQTAEQRNSLSNEHGHARDNEPLNGPLAQKPLNRDSPVDVQVLDPAGSELRDDLRWRPGHLFHDASAHCGQIGWAAAQHNDSLVAVGPGLKSQNRLEGLAAYHNRVDAGNKLVVAVGLASALRQKVEIAVSPSNKAVNAGADKHRCRHRALLAASCLTIDSNPFSRSNTLLPGTAAADTVAFDPLTVRRIKGNCPRV